MNGLLHNQVDQLVLDHDGLADLAAVLLEEIINFLVGQNIGNNGIVVQIGIHHHGAAHLAVDLNGDGNLSILALLLGVGGPGLIGDGIVMTQQLPQLFAHVGDDAGKHLDEALGVFSGAGACFIDLVDEYHHLERLCTVGVRNRSHNGSSCTRQSRLCFCKAFRH